MLEAPTAVEDPRTRHRRDDSRDERRRQRDENDLSGNEAECDPLRTLQSLDGPPCDAGDARSHHRSAVPRTDGRVEPQRPHAIMRSTTKRSRPSHRGWGPPVSATASKSRAKRRRKTALRRYQATPATMPQRHRRIARFPRTPPSFPAGSAYHRISGSTPASLDRAIGPWRPAHARIPGTTAANLL